MSEALKTTHQIEILKELLSGGISVSIDSKASNRNQYYPPIKKQGIELVEVRKPNITNKGSHKERSLRKTKENIKRAEEYLNKLLSKSNANKAPRSN